MPRGVYERKEKSAVSAAQVLNAADAPEKNAAAPKEEKASVDTNVNNNPSKLKLFTM